jgi:hypothetical protein
LKLQCDEPLSNLAFNFNLRRCITALEPHETKRSGSERAARLSNVSKQPRMSNASIAGHNSSRGLAGRRRLPVTKPELKSAVGVCNQSTRLKLKCDEPLLNVAFNFDLRRYSTALDEVGRCRLTVSEPELKACLVSALATKM